MDFPPARALALNDSSHKSSLPTGLISLYRGGRNTALGRQRKRALTEGSGCASGSQHSDNLYGNGVANSFFGGDGDDMLVGRKGDDSLHGDERTDQENGGAGIDTCVAEAENCEQP